MQLSQPRNDGSLKRDEAGRVAASCRRFAEEEARGKSPLYEELAGRAAADPEIIAFLLTLPRAKRQPNLLLGAVRFLFGTQADWPAFRQTVLGQPEPLRALMLRRSTQTNEPGRCAALLPVLASLPPPLALIEVGASAGLCLLPDLYGYDYGGGRVLRAAADDGMAPLFPCAVTGPAPLPSGLPRIVWRAGLDLAPVDLVDPDERAWLEALVWPEQTERLARLRAATAIALRHRPRLVCGDLRTDLAALAAAARNDATLVVFHTAVLAYVPSQPERDGFARSAREVADYWIANEGPDVFPDIAARAPTPGPPGAFLLSVNGEPAAWTDPHGALLDWIVWAKVAPPNS